MTPGPDSRRRGIRRTGSLHKPAGTRHLKATESGATGILGAPLRKQANRAHVGENIKKLDSGGDRGEIPQCHFGGSLKIAEDLAQ